VTSHNSNFPGRRRGYAGRLRSGFDRRWGPPPFRLITFIYGRNQSGTVKVITVRIPDEDAKSLEAIEREEKVDRAGAVRKILSEGIQRWKLRRALELLRQRRVTLRTAARMAGIPYGEMFDLAAREGPPSGYSLDDLRRDLQEG